MNSKNEIHIAKTNSIKETFSSFGAVILEYRTMADMSQSELASLLDTSRNTIANWEKDKNLPDVSVVSKLSLVLGVPLYELFNIANDSIPSVNEYTLLKQYRQLSNVSQNVIYNMANTMLEQESLARDEFLRNKFCILPLQTTPAAAGVGIPEIELPPEHFFVSKNRLSQAADAIIRVSGDSMEPKYHNGDYIYLQYTNTCNDGDDVVCVYYEGFIIKRCRNNKLYSLNKKRSFGDNHEFDDIRIVGKVLGIIDEDELPDEGDISTLESVFSKELREFDEENGIK